MVLGGVEVPIRLVRNQQVETNEQVQVVAGEGLLSGHRDGGGGEERGEPGQPMGE